jgi:hypothetical protein
MIVPSAGIFLYFDKGACLLVGVSGFCRVLKSYRISGSGLQISGILPDFYGFLSKY